MVISFTQLVQQVWATRFWEISLADVYVLFVVKKNIMHLLMLVNIKS